MGDMEHTNRSLADRMSTGLTRRQFVQIIGAGVAGSTLVSLLAACADDDDDVAVEDPIEEPDPEADDTDDEPDLDDEEPDPDDDELEEPTPGGQVSIYWREAAPDHLQPLHTTAGNVQQIQRLLFGSLVKMNDALEPVPDMSDAIDISEDATVFTFELNPDMRFNDGEPLTAADVIFTLERAIDERTGSFWSGRLQHVEGVEEFNEQQADSVSGLAMPDDHTVEITLAEPEGAFLVTLCNFSGLGILPRHILEDVPPEELLEHSFSVEPTVSAGAFKFVHHATDQYLELGRNEEYGGDIPALERIFMVNLTIDVAVAQLDTGELDLTSIPFGEIERTERVEHVVVESQPSPSMSFIAVNMNEEHITKDLRKAIIHAIDREGIVNQVFHGQAQVVNSPIFGPDWMGIPEGLDPYEYDPDTAREYLEASGWDTDQSIVLSTSATDHQAVSAMAVIQEQLREIGIDLEIATVDSGEFVRRYVQDNEYELVWLGGGVFRADPGVSETYFASWNHTPGGGNGAHYTNDEVDDLLVQGKALMDPEERRPIYTEIAQILNDDLPFIPLWSPNSVFGRNERLVGFAAPSYVANVLWNAEDWSVAD